MGKKFQKKAEPLSDDSSEEEVPDLVPSAAGFNH